MIEIGDVRDTAAVKIARALFREYQQTLGVDLNFQAYETEQSITTRYADKKT